MRRAVFEASALEDLMFWVKSDPKIARKIIELIEETLKNPFSGTGKPEPLKFELKGYWSKRINQEHRFVYKITDDYIIIASCRYHYT